MSSSSEGSRLRMYKIMLAISAVMGYADQGSDLLFVGNSMTSGNATLVVTGSAGLFFILVFSLSAGLKAFGEKRSVWEFFLALFGIDIGLRTWQVCRDPTADLKKHMEGMASHFAAESLIEGLPLTLIAFTNMYTLTDPCQLVTCDPVAISKTFPEHVHVLPDSPRPISAAEVSLLHGECGALPLTSDGWFTLPRDAGAPEVAVERESGFFERIIEFSINGITAANGTVVTGDVFSCVGWSSPDPHHWLGLFQVPPFREAWIPILSAALGILAAAYHLTRMYTTNEATSLWALPPPDISPAPDLRDGTVAKTAAPAPASTHAAGLGDAVAPACASSTSEWSAAVAEAAVAPADDGGSSIADGFMAAGPGAVVGTLQPGCPDGNRVRESLEASAGAACAADDLQRVRQRVSGAGGGFRPSVVVPAEAEPVVACRVDMHEDEQVARSQGGAARHARRSVRQLLDAQPELGQILAFNAAVYVCFALDITITLHLWWQMIATVLLVAPHLSLHGGIIACVFVLAALRGAAVAGVGSVRAWLSACSKVLFTVVPLHVTSAATLRASPRCGRYAAVAAGIACNVAMQAVITIAAALPKRADGYIWRSSWRRVTLSWVMLGIHAALVVAVFRMKSRIMAHRTLAGSTRVSRCA